MLKEFFQSVQHLVGRWQFWFELIFILFSVPAIMELLPQKTILVEIFCKPIIRFGVDNKIFAVGFSLGDPGAGSVVLFSQLDIKDGHFVFGAKVVGDHVLDVHHEMLENNDVLSLSFWLGKLQVDANSIKVGQQKQSFVFFDERGNSNRPVDEVEFLYKIWQICLLLLSDFNL